MDLRIGDKVKWTCRRFVGNIYTILDIDTSRKYDQQIKFGWWDGDMGIRREIWCNNYDNMVQSLIDGEIEIIDRIERLQPKQSIRKLRMT